MRLESALGVQNSLSGFDALTKTKSFSQAVLTVFRWPMQGTDGAYAFIAGCKRGSTMGIVSVKELCLVFFAAMPMLACARNDSRQTHPLINETYTILPSAIGIQGTAQTVAQPTPPTKALIVKFTINEEALTDLNATLNFYKSYTTQAPDLSVSWEDWLTWHQSSGCSAQQLAWLETFDRGVALVCDARINLSNYQIVEIVDSQGRKRAATSWTVRPFADDTLIAEFVL